VRSAILHRYGAMPRCTILAHIRVETGV
jgi:hypothetical protein